VKTQAEARLRSKRRAALKELDTGADNWSTGHLLHSGRGRRKKSRHHSGPKPQLSVANAADMAAMAQAADPNHVRNPASLKATVEAGNKAWTKLQELHNTAGDRGRTANRRQWVPPPGSPPMPEPPLIYDTPTAAREQEWETGRAAISPQFFQTPDLQFEQEQPITSYPVTGPVMASIPDPSTQYFESPVEEQAAPAQMEEPRHFVAPNGQVVEVGVPQQQLHEQPRFFESPNGAIVESDGGVMRQVGQVGAPQAAAMNVVPTSESTKLSQDTDDLDGSLGVVHSAPLVDPTVSPENEYTVEGTSFPTAVTVMAPTSYLPAGEGQVPSLLAPTQQIASGSTEEMAAAPTEQMAAARTQSLYGLGGRDDDLEGVYKVQGMVKPVPCDGPIQHSDTPLCVAKKAMAQALQAEKDVIAAHEKIAQQKVCVCVCVCVCVLCLSV
jgi:hypothetical protein